MSPCLVTSLLNGGKTVQNRRKSQKSSIMKQKLKVAKNQKTGGKVTLSLVKDNTEPIQPRSKFLAHLHKKKKKDYMFQLNIIFRGKAARSDHSERAGS